MSKVKHLQIWGTCLLLCTGCDNSTQSSRANPVALIERDVEFELEWTEQIDAVRGGKSTKLIEIARPVTPNEFRMLRTDCRSLTVLDVDLEAISAEECAATLQSLPNLRQLKVTSHVDSDMFVALLEAIPQLQILNVPQGDFDNEAFRSVANCQKLRLLRMSSPHVNDDGMEVLKELPELRYLHLINVPITDSALSIIAELSTLQSFYLDGGQCTEAALSELVSVRPDLHFHWNQLHLRSDTRAPHH